jgi:hypothetical protein
MKKRGNPGGCKCCDAPAATTLCPSLTSIGPIPQALHLTDVNGTIVLNYCGTTSGQWVGCYTVSLPGYRLTTTTPRTCVAATVTVAVGYKLICPNQAPLNSANWLLYTEWTTVRRDATFPGEARARCGFCAGTCLAGTAGCGPLGTRLTAHDPAIPSDDAPIGNLSMTLAASSPPASYSPFALTFTEPANLQSPPTAGNECPAPGTIAVSA